MKIIDFNTFIISFLIGFIVSILCKHIIYHINYRKVESFVNNSKLNENEIKIILNNIFNGVYFKEFFPYAYFPEPDQNDPWYKVINEEYNDVWDPEPYPNQENNMWSYVNDTKDIKMSLDPKKDIINSFRKDIYGGEYKSYIDSYNTNKQQTSSEFEDMRYKDNKLNEINTPDKGRVLKGGKCSNERNKRMNQSTDSRGIDNYIPVCKIDGDYEYYRSNQCGDSICWCVNSEGETIPKTEKIKLSLKGKYKEQIQKEQENYQDKIKDMSYKELTELALNEGINQKDIKLISGCRILSNDSELGNSGDEVCNIDKEQKLREKLLSHKIQDLTESICNYNVIYDKACRNSTCEGDSLCVPCNKHVECSNLERSNKYKCVN